MAFVFLICCAVLIGAIACFTINRLLYSHQVLKWKRSNFPVLRPFLFFGHKYFLNLFSNSATVGIDRIYRENGDKDLVAFFVTFIPVILLRDPKLIKKVLLIYSKKAFPSNFVPPEDDPETQAMPLLTNDKAKWKIGRTSMAPFFSESTIWGQAFDKFKQQMDKLWTQTEIARSSGQSIDVQDLARAFTFDGIALWGFGDTANHLDSRGELRRGILDGLHASSYRTIFIILSSIAVPFLQRIKRIRFVNRQYIKIMKNLLQRQIKFRDANSVNNDDFIDYLMSLRDTNQCLNDDDQEGQGIDLVQMTGYSLTLLLGSTGTIPQLCITVTHLLSLHPEIQDKVKAEIVELMKKHQVNELTYEVIQDLQFTRQCILESCRLYPPLPAIFRRCTEDFQIAGTDYIFRKGDQIILSPYSLHHDPKYFKDPEKFVPDRFSPENEHLITSDAYYLSFGFGLRKCPGAKLGVSIVTLFAAALIHKYEIKPRSHLKAMETTDFDPMSFFNNPKKILLVDLVPRD